MKRSQLVIRFGKRLRGLRLEHGLSQEDLAAMAGLQQNAVSMIENGTRAATLVTIEKLAKALRTTPRDLIPPS